MDDSILIYFERLELMAFFSGYVAIYIFLNAFTNSKKTRLSKTSKRLLSLLPYSYTLTAILFWGYVLRNLFPEYTVHHYLAQFNAPFWQLIALASILSWVPIFRKKGYYSLLHSLFFFGFLLIDFYYFIIGNNGPELLQKDMKVFTDSLLLNLSTLIVIVFIRAFSVKIKG